MNSPTTLDLASVRTFLYIAEGDRFATAAGRAHLSLSAVSLQMRRLEVSLGVRLFAARGRRKVLTPDGERFLGHARRLLALNDDALASFGHHGPVPLRFGTTQDFEALLPSMLRRFSAAQPSVEVSVRVERSLSLIAAVASGDLDVALAVRTDSPLARDTVLRERMVWIGRNARGLGRGGSVPLVLFEAPCPFRSAALDALANAGRASRVTFSSPSLSGVRAAVDAGFGVTARTRALARRPLAVVPASVGLPPLPEVDFCVYAWSAPSPTARSLIDGLHRMQRSRPPAP